MLAQCDRKARPLHYLLAAISMARGGAHQLAGSVRAGRRLPRVLVVALAGCTWKIWANRGRLGVYAYAVSRRGSRPSLLSATAANEQHYDVRVPFPAQHLIYAGLMLVALVLIEWGLARWNCRSSFASPCCSPS